MRKLKKYTKKQWKSVIKMSVELKPPTVNVRSHAKARENEII